MDELFSDQLMRDDLQIDGKCVSHDQNDVRGSVEPRLMMARIFRSAAHTSCACYRELPLWLLAALIVTVRQIHLPNFSINGDGVRVFLSGHHRPYR
ncbi:hypothetical protein ACTABX_24485 [Pseudomonas syringae]